MRCLGAVTCDVADAGLDVCCAVRQGCEIGCWDCQPPGAARGNRGGVAFAAEDNGDGLPRFHIGGGAGELQIAAFFGGINHIVSGKGVNGNRHGREIDRDRMANAGCGSGGIGARNGNIDRSRRPVCDICRRNTDAPGAIGEYRCAVGDAIDNHRQRRPRRQSATATGDHQRLSVLNAVNHIITCHGIDPQARQVGIYHDIVRCGASIICGIGHRGADGQFSVAQRLQNVRRYADAPA